MIQMLFNAWKPPKTIILKLKQPVMFGKKNIYILVGTKVIFKMFPNAYMII